jgi:hypothetical protein
LNALSLSLLPGFGLGLCPFAFGLDPVQLRSPGTLVRRRPELSHGPGHLARVGRPFRLVHGQAALAQGDQVGVGPTLIKPGEGVVQFPPGR